LQIKTILYSKISILWNFLKLRKFALAKALKTDQLAKLAFQEEASGNERVDPDDLNEGLATIVQQPRSEDQESCSQSADGSAGK